jgi:hypothetical protein
MPRGSHHLQKGGWILELDEKDNHPQAKYIPIGRTPTDQYRYQTRTEREGAPLHPNGALNEIK